MNSCHCLFLFVSFSHCPPPFSSLSVSFFLSSRLLFLIIFSASLYYSSLPSPHPCTPLYLAASLWLSSLATEPLMGSLTGGLAGDVWMHHSNTTTTTQSGERHFQWREIQDVRHCSSYSCPDGAWRGRCVIASKHCCLHICMCTCMGAVYMHE